MNPNDVTKSDHAAIWLEPLAHEDRAEEGRTWCKDDVWSSECMGEECGGPTKYVRSDIVEELQSRLEKQTDHDGYCNMHGRHLGYKCPECPYEERIEALESKLGRISDVLARFNKNQITRESDALGEIYEIMEPSK